MTRKLVLIHGRSQENKDSIALKREWIDALKEGLDKSGLNLPIAEDKVQFPYYGDTLYDLSTGIQGDDVADIVVRGNYMEPQFNDFMQHVLREVLVKKGISESKIREEVTNANQSLGHNDIIERGLLNWKWVQGIIAAIDKYVPGTSGATVALATADVYHYLTKPGVRDVLETGVRQAITVDVEHIVVAHSLGSIVAYNLLRRDGSQLGWRIPLFITLGSPLAITRIKRSLTPYRHPSCVGKWFNAMDPDDIVALHPLDYANFPIDPEIENKTDVENDTDNQHGISGYLKDREVARRIYEALTA